MSGEKKNINGLWPDVSTIEGAYEATTEGAKAAGAIVLLTLVLSLYAMYKQPGYSIPALALFEMLVFFAIAIGTWRLSRISAVAGLTVFVLEKGYLMATAGPNGLRGILLFLFISYFLFQGVRGTFGYHRLIKSHPEINAAERVE